jgi:type IV pilus assembly protein PilM
VKQEARYLTLVFWIILRYKIADRILAYNCRRKKVAKSNIGLDIGTSSVKAVEVVETSNKITVIRAGEVELDRNIVVGGEVLDQEGLTEAIEQLWLSTGFKKAPVTIGISGFKINARQFDLQWEEEEKFRKALPLRLSNELPINLADAMIDYHVVGNFKRQLVTPTGTTDLLMQRSLVVAVSNILIESAADAVADANVRLKKADFSAFALLRAADAVGGRKQRVPGLPNGNDEIVAEAVLDIGAQITTLAIHERGRVLFVRIIQGGGESITRALSENLKISFDAAEILKKNLSIDFESESWAALPEVISAIDEQLYLMAKDITNAMTSYQIQEIRRSVEYFLQNTPNETSIDRVLLSGGTSLLPGFADRLSAELRAPVGRLAPITAYGKGDGKRPSLDPRMSIAFGLALRQRG